MSLKEKKAPPPKREVARKPGDWVEIADPTPAKYGTVYVLVGTQAGSFGKLRLDAVKGKVVVRRVKVHFGDGSVKVFPVGKTIDDKRQKTTFVELGGPKTIDQVIVTTENTKGEYAIYGSLPGAGGGPATCC